VAVIALASMSNAGVLATSRKPFAMSRDHLIRLIGYDNYAQSQGASMVVHRPGA